VRHSLNRITAIPVVVLLLAYSLPKSDAQNRDAQVLFVCEHGNVKSLMAASYFNKLAQEHQLPFHAISRGNAPNSTTVPPAIIQWLRGDGFDVSSFHPSAVKASDVSASQRVIIIGTTLPVNSHVVAEAKIERWDDVPPASDDYDAARDSLKRHIKKLVEELATR